MKTRNIALALAALTTLTFSALATTSASASQWGGHGGGQWSGGQWSGGHGHGFFGQDTPMRGTHVWRPPHTHTYNPCDCFPQVRPTYVPVRVPVYVPVKVPVRVEVPVPVKVPVYVPAPQPTYVSPPVQHTADPCDCEEGHQGHTHHTHTRPPVYPQTQMQGPQYDQNRGNLAATALEKK